MIMSSYWLYRGEVLLEQELYNNYYYMLDLLFIWHIFDASIGDARATDTCTDLVKLSILA